MQRLRIRIRQEYQCHLQNPLNNKWQGSRRGNHTVVCQMRNCLWFSGKTWHFFFFFSLNVITIWNVHWTSARVISRRKRIYSIADYFDTGGLLQETNSKVRIIHLGWQYKSTFISNAEITSRTLVTNLAGRQKVHQTVP